MTLTPSDTLFESINAKIAESAESLGGVIVENIQNKLSVPVERHGSEVIRSKRGEHPRRDSGRLLEATTCEVRSDELSADLEISNPTPYGPFLDDPNKLDRPIVQGIVDEFEDDWAGIVADAINDG
jgi:hypothetical protein